MTPEQIAKLEQLKKDWGKASTQEAINEVIDENIK
jgi:hypothetical protein